jgi:hypothetical protein
MGVEHGTSEQWLVAHGSRRRSSSLEAEAAIVRASGRRVAVRAKCPLGMRKISFERRLGSASLAQTGMSRQVGMVLPQGLGGSFAQPAASTIIWTRCRPLYSSTDRR